MEKEEMRILPVKDDTLEIWETRLDGEPPKAFTAFCAYKAMGLRRDIKECMRLHNIDMKKYGTWARWARLFDWKERAAAESLCLAESARQLLPLSKSCSVVCI